MQIIIIIIKSKKAYIDLYNIIIVQDAKKFEWKLQNLQRQQFLKRPGTGQVWPLWDQNKVQGNVQVKFYLTAKFCIIPKIFEEVMPSLICQHFFLDAMTSLKLHCH